MAYAHDHGVRVHVTVNTMPRSGEVDALPAHLERLNDAGVDAEKGRGNAPAAFSTMCPESG